MEEGLEAVARRGGVDRRGAAVFVKAARLKQKSLLFVICLHDPLSNPKPTPPFDRLVGGVDVVDGVC